MGTLARHLAAEFKKLQPSGWDYSLEAPIFSAELAQRIGYSPRADLVLTGPGQRKIAVELEISHADPVANQVKFLLASRERQLGSDEAMVQMFSPAVTRGRRNVAGVFARHLRAEGRPVFQVSLLPQFEPDQIRRLNQSTTLDELAAMNLPIRAELDRVLSVVEPKGENEHRIHFVGDVTDVVANVWAWNDEIPAKGCVWGQRNVQFFVFDQASGLFAPSKFCAFIPAAKPGGRPPPPTMTLEVYASLGENDPRFDGHRARRHLVDKLAFKEMPLAGSGLETRFRTWLNQHNARIGRRDPVTVHVPPVWYSAGGVEG